MNKDFIKEKEIIEFLRSGWVIGFESGWATHYWMQKGSLGSGQETERIHKATFWSMEKKGLLKKRSKSDFGAQEFTLLEK